MPSKSSSNDSLVENNDEAPVRKDKKFKRIRGLLGGDKKDKKHGKGKGKNKGKHADDDATYNVNVDERSIATAPAKHDEPLRRGSDAKRSYMLKVVLLLMDPKSRRFELLQLEFDSLKALVSDVLAQIPVSVTEDVLREQTYLGICGHDGKEMPLNALLSEFCKGSEVFVAVPKGVAAKECARLAVPILTDDKVVNMLRSSDINMNEWLDNKNKKTSKKAVKLSSSSGKVIATDDDSHKGGKSAGLIAVILAAIVLQVYHLYISAPIKPGHIVSPGIHLSKCGVLSILPTCSNEYMTFADEETIVMKDAADKVLWSIRGNTCKKGDKGCIRGMKVGEDGELIIGGKVVDSVRTYTDDVKLSPWPFAEEPKIRIKRDTPESSKSSGD
ncbi:hypothetical protein MPSEU_000086300 [Mayamaea pseudoterrestris]|nr:hypothetical protein MPSEU_000086300 [Mayamaea pseudoterrestris]